MKEFVAKLQQFKQALEHLPHDIKVEVAEAFDNNFENESFFGTKWTPSKYVENENKKNGKARKLLNRHGGGGLRGSFKYEVSGSTITITSNKPYAAIHNEGGNINHPGGTAFYWNGKKNQPTWVRNSNPLSAKLPRTKAHNITIPQRQFIGEHPQLNAIIENEINELFDRIFK